MQSVTRGLVAALILVAAAVPAAAQDEKPLGVWQRDFELGLNILQSSYSNNWNGGDKGSIVWSGVFDAKMEKQYSESANWRNTLKLTYGQTHNQERGADGDLFWKKPDKTDDIIDFESLFRWTQSSGWDPFLAVNFTSMFDDRSDPENRSLFLNPMTVKPSAGVSRTLVENEDRRLALRVGVAYLLNSRAFFSDPAPSTATRRESSTEMAAEAVAEYAAKTLDGKVDWESKLTVTKPFVYSGKSVLEDDVDPVAEGLPEDIADYTTTVDVDWENTFSANITSVISVKLFVRWVYDKYDNTVKPVVEDGDLVNGGTVAQSIRKSGQFKQTLALGFGYTF